MARRAKPPNQLPGDDVPLKSLYKTTESDSEISVPRKERVAESRETKHALRCTR